MKTLEFLAKTYSVAIDTTSFRAQPNDSPAEPSMLLCRVDLTGNSDLRWQKAFYFTQWDSIENFFYRLSKTGDSIAFPAPRLEAAQNVKLRLRALASFLSLVNSNANRHLGAHSNWASQPNHPQLAMSA